MAYNHTDIEHAAQEKWAQLDLYHTDLTDESKEPYYLLVEFPYPSGDLHIGHWYAFAVTDIYARMLRLRGRNVLFPIGFDAFGLPAENAAIKHGVDPKEWTLTNIERMRLQLKSMGASFDWSKEVVACSPEYYQWTQWLFARIFEHGLAERREAAVKWCPKDQTVLANEQVLDGKCERCGTEVEEKRLTQWFLKITQYADRLLSGLDALPWREEIKEAQRAWIGKSEGAHLTFALTGREESIAVFTTRPDTIFGVTYVVLAPEHPLVATLLPSLENAPDVEAYIASTIKKTERERSENKDKTGVQLVGVMAINPATHEEIPVYIADYALASYGTGAVMAVPAHDERDYAFAKKLGLRMRQVVVPCANDSKNPPQEGFEEVKRDTIVVHLKDTTTGKFAVLDWHGTLEGITTAIMGGIEEGQSPEDAVRAEVKEEAGLEHIRIINQLPWITAARYCASHKKQNRYAHTYAFMAEVDGLSGQREIADAERSLHTLTWVDETDVLKRLTPDHQKLIWQLLHTEAPLTGDGYLMQSGTFDGRGNREAITDIVSSVGGTLTTNYRIRDWLVSRQRYWGCPIPIVYDPDGKPHSIPAEHLPWLLPTDVDFTPTGKAPLASSKELKERVTRIFGEGWTPEYDTFDTFVDSSWYFLRYLDPLNTLNFSNASLMKKWLPINRYSGGSEHTTMHLLYARFFTKILYDLALVPIEEPFTERFNRGLIMGPDGQKMSKSKGNVVNPDEFVRRFGADAVRLYLAFIGPYNEPGSYPWSLEGVASMGKFLERVERLVNSTIERRDVERYSAPTLINGLELKPQIVAKTLALAAKKISEDGDKFKFNTGVAQLMIALNELEHGSGAEGNPLEFAEVCTFLTLLAPFAPHLAEHLWEKLGQRGSVHQAEWPSVSVDAASEYEVVVQVNGKRRGSLTLATDEGEDVALAAARALPAVAAALNGREPARVIYIQNRLINLVV